MPRINNKSTTVLNRFQQTGNVPDQADRVKPRRFLTTSSRRNRFLSSRKLGRLLRNATVTRVCDRTVRNRLHAGQLKSCLPMLEFRCGDGIIEPVVLLYLQQHNVGIFQYDNVSPHTERHTQNILRIHNINVLQWPTSHDVNNIRDLECALQAEWVRIPLQVIRQLICSMRHRCLAVLASNGGHIRY